MNRKGISVSLVIVLLLGSIVVLDVTMDITPRVEAITIYVDDSGGADYTTIQEGVDAAIPGDTVFVYSGNYYQNVVVYKKINLVGENVDTTIIDATPVNYDVLRITSNGVNISGFTIKGAGDIDDTGNGYAGIYLYSVQNCYLFNNKLTSNIDYGIRLYSSSNNIIINNIITNSIAFPNYEDGIILDSSSNNKIIGNDISNYMGGITLTSSSNNNNIMALLQKSNLDHIR